MFGPTTIGAALGIQRFPVDMVSDDTSGLSRLMSYDEQNPLESSVEHNADIVK